MVSERARMLRCRDYATGEEGCVGGPGRAPRRAASPALPGRHASPRLARSPARARPAHVTQLAAIHSAQYPLYVCTGLFRVPTFRTVNAV